MKKLNKIGIVFYLRNDKVKNGKAPIYARIIVDGIRVNFAIKEKISVSQWDHGKGRANSRGIEGKTINAQMDQIRTQIMEAYQDLKFSGKVITPETVKNRYLGQEEKIPTLLELFDYHNDLEKDNLAWGTLKNYYTTKKYFEVYLKKSIKRKDIHLQELNYRFLTGFERFLKTNDPLDPSNPCNQNTIMKHIERFRKIVNLAVKNDWIEKDPFLQFKKKFITKERGFLDQFELNRLEKIQPKTQRLEQVKDLFVFSCYTGLSYIDVQKLTPTNIHIGIDGAHWINTVREKTKQAIKVPLLKQAFEIIKKYENDPQVLAKGSVLPRISNQKLNTYLKELADLFKTSKNLTYHLARHTFATTVTLTNGVPIETVSKLLGHSSIRTTQIYAKVVEKKVSEDMKALAEKINGKNDLKVMKLASNY